MPVPDGYLLDIHVVPSRQYGYKLTHGNRLDMHFASDDGCYRRRGGKAAEEEVTREHGMGLKTRRGETKVGWII